MINEFIDEHSTTFCAIFTMICSICILLLCIIYLIYCFRYKFYFYPTRTPYQTPDQQHFYISYIHKDIKLSAYSTKPLNEITSTDTIIIYFHGNAGNITIREEFLNTLATTLNSVIITFDYQEFGSSGGYLTHETVLNDGVLVAEWCKRAYPSNKKIYFGESIGTSIATYTATIYPPSGLILKSPFYNMASLIIDLYSLPCSYAFLEYMINDFKTNIWLKESTREYKMPSMIIYNTNDEIIPRDNLERLVDMKLHSRTLEISGTHNDFNINECYKQIQQFINDII